MTKQTAKVVRFYQTGDASVLKLEEQALVKPGPGEVRIKVEAIGLNRAEIMFREGQYLEAPEFPSKLGYEASGVIDALGEGVDTFVMGERVSSVPAFSMGQYGVYGESATLPATAVAKYDDSLSPIEGTAIWMPYITAYGLLLEVGNLTRGQVVLITAASSSVGIAAIQIAKAAGAEVIATTRGADKVKSLYQIGADHVIATDDQELVDAVMELTDGKGVNLVLDPIGGPILAELADAAAPLATIVEYGALDKEPTPFPLFVALGKGLTIRGYTIFETSTDPKRLAQATDFINSGLKAGTLKPLIDRVFTLSEIRKAHDYMSSNQQMGKIVVTV